MRKLLRGATIVIGIGFLLQGAVWLVAPARAAASLGMPLLDGLGRSTQVGDFASFFTVAGALMVIGSRPGRGLLLYGAAGLLGGAAIGRTIAWAAQGADFAAAFIAVEALVAALLVAAARADRVVP
jgi:hypothetical protein